jgi:acyl-CoA synthetase (AMP-forming)/AMP-acid ligase II
VLNERIPGERCAVLASNGLAALDPMIAGAKRGLGTVQLPYRATPAELERMLDTADAAGLVFDDTNADLAAADEHLERLLEYDFDAGLVYHGSSVSENAAAKLETFVDFEGKQDKSFPYLLL